MNVRFINLLLLALISFRCIIMPDYPDDTENTTFTIQEPDEFNCYKRHQYFTTPVGDKISVVIALRTYFWDGTKKVDLTNKTLEVNPNTTSFPVTMVGLMPNDKDFIGGVEITIEGLDCSDCANGRGDPAEPSNSCPANQPIPSALTN